MICSSCQLAKPSLKKNLHCGACNNLLCKECACFVEETFFSFLKSIPAELAHSIYCGPCYETHVEPAKQAYLQTMRRAKNISVFLKKEKHIPLIRRAKLSVAVKDCKDKNETILRLAFFAAEQSYNAVIEVELIAEKIKINGYQTHHWHGTGFPADVRESNK